MSNQPFQAHYSRQTDAVFDVIWFLDLVNSKMSSWPADTHNLIEIILLPLRDWKSVLLRHIFNPKSMSTVKCSEYEKSVFSWV